MLSKNTWPSPAPLSKLCSQKSTNLKSRRKGTKITCTCSARSAKRRTVHHPQIPLRLLRGLPRIPVPLASTISERGTASTLPRRAVTPGSPGKSCKRNTRVCKAKETTSFISISKLSFTKEVLRCPTKLSTLCVRDQSPAPHDRLLIFMQSPQKWPF